jgi:glucose-6-phosphate isomerase
MIQLDLSFPFLFSTPGLPHKLLSKRQDLGFIDADETVDIQEIQDYILTIAQDFHTLVVLWIGGSALGTKAILEALKGKYYNETPGNTRKVYVLDNIDTHSFSDILPLLDIKKTLFCVISKSGNTIETLSEYIFFREKVQRVTLDWKKHFSFILWETYSLKSQFERDFKVFSLAWNIWGRFSVFTPVGLVPLAFAGINIWSLMNALRENKQRFLLDDPIQNTALQLALLQYHFYTQEHRNITVFFPYSSRMFQVGEWYKQLMGESIGKDGEWITLTSSLWVTDQHSQLQLYQDGPQDKFFLFLDIDTCEQDYMIDSRSELTFGKLLKIEKYGTYESLKREKIPLATLTLDTLSENSIAELLFMFEFQIAYLGELFEINAFNQPGVEKSKIITKQKLTVDFPNLDIAHKAFYE